MKANLLISLFLGLSSELLARFWSFAQTSPTPNTQFLTELLMFSSELEVPRRRQFISRHESDGFD